MTKNRLEAFSDGVIAIIITIMVLEFKIPHEATLSSLLELWPKFLSYILSYVYVGIYWNNHHHMLHITSKVNGTILWANLHLLFWLSLIPFSTAWMGENHFAAVTIIVYGIVLFMCAISYFLLHHRIVNLQGKDSLLSKAIGSDSKGKISVFCYSMGILLANYLPWLAFCLYVVVALMWLVPDKRIENLIKE